MTGGLPAIRGLVSHFVAAVVCQDCAEYLALRSETAPTECAAWRSWRLSGVSEIAWDIGRAGEVCSRCGGKALNVVGPAHLEEEHSSLIASGALRRFEEATK